MNREQFDKIVDYSKLQASTGTINEALYQLFYDENDPFISIQDVDSQLVVPNKKYEEGDLVKFNDKQVTMLTGFRSDVCFGRLLSELSPDKKQVTRMWYKIRITESCITDKIATQWLNLGKEFKFVPSSFEVVHIRKKSSNPEHYVLAVVNNIQDISAPVFYLGAAFLRCLREKPQLVIAGIHLMEEVGLNPYVSFVFLHKYCVNSLGHMPLNIEKSYGQLVGKNTIEAIKVTAGYIVALRRLIFSYTDGEKMGKAGRFYCSSTIDRLMPRELADIEVNVYDTMEPEFMNILECDPGSKAEEEAIRSYIKEAKGNSNVK